MFSRSRVQIKTPEQIIKMRRAGLIVAQIHDAVRAAIAPGATTADLDAVAAATVKAAGAKSNFLGYYGYPASICVSVNDEVVHGIPSGRELAEGDVVSIDAGAVIDGWHGDAAFTAIVGEGAPKDQALLEATQNAMWAGIARLASATHLEQVSEAIFAASTGYGVVRDYTGHGIGTAMHQPPDVPNYPTHKRSLKLRAGMCLAIEPMLTRGGDEVDELDDEWTVVTADGSRAAHFENTVALTGSGIWVLASHDGGRSALAARGIDIAPVAQ